MSVVQSKSFKEAYEVIKNSIGCKYKVEMERLSKKGEEFCLNSGIIERVLIDEDNVLQIWLDGENLEKFSLNALKGFACIETGHLTEFGEYKCYKLTYNDGSYFKIYIENKGELE